MIEPFSSCIFYFSERFAFCITLDAYHGSLFSRTGWINHVPQPAPVGWVGMNAWQCLRSSVFTNFPPELYDQKEQDKAVQAANDRYTATRKIVSKTYGYKETQSFKDCLQVFVSLTPGKDRIFTVASYTMKGGASWGYPTSPKNKDRNRTIPADASETLLGTTILDMLRMSTHARKTPEQVEAIWRLSGGLPTA